LFVIVSSFHTADGSPENASHTELLITGNYDTSSKVNYSHYHCLVDTLPSWTRTRFIDALLKITPNIITDPMRRSAVRNVAETYSSVLA